MIFFDCKFSSVRGGFLENAIVFSENVFIIWEEWKDQAGLDIHNSQQYLIDFIADTKTLLASPIQVFN
ncbi:putative quinol monooxygenase [Flavobacterium commune]|uniref:putative quinol monooxygenase n=1 Tax=Flavobacterium commune TaxID=1306519 RepID=UPI000B05CE9D|nr:hypothetical protein [Flavobacterium commune]